MNPQSKQEENELSAILQSLFTGKPVKSDGLPPFVVLNLLDKSLRREKSRKVDYYGMDYSYRQTTDWEPEVGQGDVVCATEPGKIKVSQLVDAVRFRRTVEGTMFRFSQPTGVPSGRDPMVAFNGVPWRMTTNFGNRFGWETNGGVPLKINFRNAAGVNTFGYLIVMPD